MTKLLLALTIATGFFQTPYKNDLTVWPELSLQHHPFENYKPLFVRGLISARTNPTQLDGWNPQTALYDVGFGFEWERFRAEWGHSCHHKLGIQKRRGDPEESYGYVKFQYRFL